MRLLLDEQHDPEAARELGTRGHEVSALAARALGRSLSDAEVLDLATAERRAVVTEDARDFAVEHRRRLAAGVAHFGVVITSPRRYPRGRRSIGGLIEGLDRLLRAHPAEDALRDQLLWLPWIDDARQDGGADDRTEQRADRRRRQRAEPDERHRLLPLRPGRVGPASSSPYRSP